MGTEKRTGLRAGLAIGAVLLLAGGLRDAEAVVLTDAWVSFERAPQAAVQEQPRWEYIQARAEGGDLQAIMSRLGAQGWEVFEVVPFYGAGANLRMSYYVLARRPAGAGARERTAEPGKAIVPHPTYQRRPAAPPEIDFPDAPPTRVFQVIGDLPETEFSTWQYTGVALVEGDTLYIQADGEVIYASDATVGPDGRGNTYSPSLLPQVSFSSLVGRAGDQLLDDGYDSSGRGLYGRGFVGSRLKWQKRGSSWGQLYLAVNDSADNDNYGAFRASIWVVRDGKVLPPLPAPGPSREPANLLRELGVGAFRKDANATCTRALKAGFGESGGDIPSEHWGEAIQQLKPRRVCLHRVNLVVVLQAYGGAERGLYFVPLISSYRPPSGQDGFGLTELDAGIIYKFRREVKGE